MRLQLVLISLFAVVADAASAQDGMPFIRIERTDLIREEISVSDGGSRVAYVPQRDIGACSEYQYAAMSTQADVARRGVLIMEEMLSPYPQGRSDYVLWTIDQNGRHRVYRAAYHVRSCLLFEERLESSAFEGAQAASQARARYDDLVSVEPVKP